MYSRRALVLASSTGSCEWRLERRENDGDVCWGGEGGGWLGYDMFYQFEAPEMVLCRRLKAVVSVSFCRLTRFFSSKMLYSCLACSRHSDSCRRASEKKGKDKSPQTPRHFFFTLRSSR